MAYFTDTSAPKRDLTQTILSKLSQWMDAAALRRAQNRMFRKTMDELSTLSNRELNDLGLSRSELRRVAYETSRSVTTA